MRIRNEKTDSQKRMLSTLEQLLELSAVDLQSALNQAAKLVQEALDADKVDAFLYDPAKDVLRAMGTSDTPLGRLQIARGLDVLPIANGGTTVRCYTSGQSLRNGHVDRVADEVPGLVHALGIRSLLAVPLEVDGERRGVLSVQSQTPGFFTAADLRFLQAVGRWVGALTHRAELIEVSTAAARASGRREAADELILVLAHDLRNYLAPLKSRIDLLKYRAQREARQVDVRDSDRALQALGRLTRLVANLLDVGRLEQGLFTMQPSPVELMAMARETAQALETAEVHVEVSGPAELVLSADADRLRQILENLISNAIKHSPCDKVVQVRIHTETQHDPPQRQAIVDVADQGPGIPPEVLPRLFERFSRAGSEQGLGLGLYLANRIASAHGGSLSVSDSVSGASFRLRLPMNAPDSE